MPKTKESDIRPADWETAVIDICLNLQSDRFEHDRFEVLERARNVGVERIVLTGSCLQSTQLAIDWAMKEPDFLCATAGIHPHQANEYSSAALMVLEQAAQTDVVRAIGECGLDYNRNFSSKEEQQKAFEAQIDLAQRVNLPLFLHQRDAHSQFLDTLKSAGNLPRTVVHCFTGGRKEVEDYLNAGFYIGVTGWICDERRGEALRDSVQLIPLDRLLIETDAPWLTPRDLRPKPHKGRNEPAFLPHIAKAVAQYHGTDLLTLCRATTENAKRFFRWS